MFSSVGRGLFLLPGCLSSGVLRSLPMPRTRVFRLACEFIVRLIADIRASCLKCQHSCFVGGEQNPSTAPCSKSGLQENADYEPRASHHIRFCSFCHQLRFLLNETQVQESGSKAQCPPGFWNSTLVLRGTRTWYSVTHWVFREPPLRGPHSRR